MKKVFHVLLIHPKINAHEVWNFKIGILVYLSMYYYFSGEILNMTLLKKL